MQRYFTNKLNDKTFILSNNDMYHIKKVMRMKDNDKIEVVYNKELYICKLDNDNINIIGKSEDNISNKKEYILAIPLISENKIDYILQKSTELGVDRIIPIRMNRSKINIDTAKEDKKIERWTKICKEASEQSKRIDIPIIDKISNFDYLNSFNGLKIMCSTNKCQTIKNFLTSNKNCDIIIIVVGPEGGLTSKEEEYLSSIGFNGVSFGSQILRSETAPLYVLSILNYEFME